MILRVAKEAQKSLGNLPQSIQDSLKGASVHSILAASLCLEKDPDATIWNAILPSVEAVDRDMPLCWPIALQELLPFGAAQILKAQRAKFQRDLEFIQASYPDLTEDEYRYAWLLVNSRSFYQVTKATRKLTKHDQMVLQPVADLFNHSSDKYCKVTFSEDGYTVTTSHDYNIGEEVFICYGNHPNDVLLVEFGFTIPGLQNQWDEITLDHYVQKHCPVADQMKLEDVGFWGNYKLDKRTPCYRTLTALRLIVCGEEQWRDVLEGRKDEDEDKEVLDKGLERLLIEATADADAMIQELMSSTQGHRDTRNSLMARWMQVGDVISCAEVLK